MNTKSLVLNIWGSSPNLIILKKKKKSCYTLNWNVSLFCEVSGQCRCGNTHVIFVLFSWFLPLSPLVFLPPHLQHRNLTILFCILHTVFVCGEMVSPFCHTGGCLYPLASSLLPNILFFLSFFFFETHQASCPSPFPPSRGSCSPHGLCTCPSQCQEYSFSRSLHGSLVLQPRPSQITQIKMLLLFSS